MAMRSEPTMFARRDQVNPQAGTDCAKDLYAQAGITNPRDDFDCAEVYVPFSWYEPMWLENLGFCAEGEGWKLTEAGATAPDGDIPWNPSGGVLSSNPIGASGMVRFGEAAQQVRRPGRRLPGRAEDREGARPRLRRRLAVLLDVGRRERQAGVTHDERRSRPRDPRARRPDEGRRADRVLRRRRGDGVAVRAGADAEAVRGQGRDPRLPASSPATRSRASR